MSGTLEGFAVGILGLSLFEAIVSSNAATGRVGGVFTAAANVIAHIASPNVSAIPDLRVKATSGAGAAAAPGGAGSSPGPSLAVARTPRSGPTKYGIV